MGFQMAPGYKEINCEVLIVGGGPAGSTTALYLSELGFEVVLVEKKKFPRETLCGEFLSHEVERSLLDLGLFDSFKNLNPIRINSFRAFNDSGIELKSNLNFEAMAIKRSLFDKILLDSAIKKGVNVYIPAEIVSIQKNTNHFTSILTDENKSQYTINSKFVIAAYGKQNILDKKLNRNFINEKSQLNGIKYHLPKKLIKEDFVNEIRIYNSNGVYCGLNHVSKDEVTVCFLEDKKISSISSKEKLIKLMNSNTLFGDLFFEEAKEYLVSAQLYGTGNIFFGKRKLVEDGIIMAGDAARVIAPVAGNGIGMAMETARIISEILHDIKLRKLSVEDLPAEYEKRFQQHFYTRLRTAIILQNILLRSSLSKLSFGIATQFPSLIPYLIKFTRRQ